MSKIAVAVGFAALVAALLIPRRASAATAYLDDFGDLVVDVSPEDLPREFLSVDDWQPGRPILDFEWGSGLSSTYDASLKNIDAFLYAIRHAEHATDDVNSGAAYRTFYGGSRFTNLRDHPVITGEKVGVPLPAEWCRKVGFASGKCVTTAAGAYQFTKPTWIELREMEPRLPDFSPASQDEAARRLLRKIGAMHSVMTGDFPRAIAIASSRWASLPGSKAGQHVRPAEFVVARINEFLNVA